MFFYVHAVKPEPTEKLYLQTGPDRKLELRWDPPAGRVPEPCLEWQMEQDGKIAPVWIIYIFVVSISKALMQK